MGPFFIHAQRSDVVLVICKETEEHDFTKTEIMSGSGDRFLPHISSSSGSYMMFMPSSVISRILEVVDVALPDKANQSSMPLSEISDLLDTYSVSIIHCIRHIS